MTQSTKKEQQDSIANTPDYSAGLRDVHALKVGIYICLNM